MRGFNAYLGVVAMLCALLTAPLFHSHDLDDHGHTISLVHAHFVEEPDYHDHHDDGTKPGYETSESHHGRPVDVYTLCLPLPGVDLAIGPEAILSVPVLVEQAEVVLPAVPRAHSPPSLRRSAPRSPPTLT